MNSNNIITLAGEFKETSELRAYCDKQYITIAKQNDKIKQLEEEVAHLKSLLTSTTEILPTTSIVEKIIVTPEEALLDAQIKLIHDRALTVELTLEETKKLDLLIKNRNLLKGNNTAIVGDSKKVDRSNISDAQLIQLAKQIKHDPNGN